MYVNMELMSKHINETNFIKGLYSHKNMGDKVDLTKRERGLIRIKVSARMDYDIKDSKLNTTRRVFDALLKEYMMSEGYDITQGDLSLLIISDMREKLIDDNVIEISITYECTKGLMQYLIYPFSKCVDISRTQMHNKAEGEFEKKYNKIDFPNGNELVDFLNNSDMDKENIISICHSQDMSVTMYYVKEVCK